MLYTGLNIKHLRTLLGLKQKDLADAISFGQNTISNYENGKSSPSHDDLVRLADYFGVPVEVIMRENLTEKFVTWDEVEKWKTNQALAKKKAQEHLQQMALTPFTLKALVEEFSESLSNLTGQRREEIRDRIYSRANALLAETQAVTRLAE